MKLTTVKYWAGNQFTVNGIPDILACINGQFHGIELKTNTGIVRGNTMKLTIDTS
jgi:hypothetical protein